MTKKIVLSLAIAASFGLAACTPSEPEAANNATNAVENTMNAAENTMNAAGNAMGNMTNNAANAM